MTTSETVMTTQEVAGRFNELAQQEKWFEIHDELFADNVKSIEPPNSPYFKYAEGKASVRKKGEEFVKKVQEFHGAHTTHPVIAGNHFAVGRSFDITTEDFGRIKIEEIMLYEMRDGQIVAEQFFYLENFFKNNSKKNTTMATSDFTTTIVVEQTPEQVFNAIINPRRWWSEEIEGSTDKLNDVFSYHYEDVHSCTVKLIEVVPDKKLVWKILDNHFNFTKDKTEWIDTKVSFEISKQGDKTQLVFTHIGLVPEYECYDACHQGWTHYIQNSLKSLIETGKGLPNAKGTPRTATEKKLTSTN